MKNLIIILITFLGFTAQAQDTEMLCFINQYRAAHGKKPLVISDKLTVIATTCNENNSANDTLIHTKLGNTVSTGEICTMSKSLPFTRESKETFVKFIKVNFNLVYAEPRTNEEVIKYAKLLSIYNFDQSPAHKKILLSNVTNVGFNVICKNIVKGEPATKTIGGKTYTFKNLTESYKFDCFVTIDFS
jgi:hypothetical protein